MFFYQILGHQLFPDQQADVDWYCGLEPNAGLKSDLVGIAVSWLFYWIFIHSVYYPCGFVIQTMVKLFYPWHGTNYVPPEITREHIKQSEMAFPLYVMVPVLADLAKKKGFASVCDSVDECGGLGMSLARMTLFFFLLEFLVFFDHWYILHIWKWGKKNLKHDLHHSYELGDEMSVWTGYAFEAVDGFSQGLPIAICQCVVAVPVIWLNILTVVIALWTMYIHVGVPMLPAPFMGADYHFLHHKYNWYNFGFFTYTFDWIFGTLKHPGPEDYKGANRYKIPAYEEYYKKNILPLASKVPKKRRKAA